ncbi:uncharacterized protein FA14DRAFT_174781 [Meira miltonrushii]|uniref:CST complex subunit Stn1 N-terminal domain-containing protein n=1 Tax=Meira miltonrushii TaxID=1280837 RepID=A0A316V2W3_9BASI|nr:uncharacterized protein FA14DRAFT_174781 [Meira miltonrushii]PWN31897.1 hypothetical protein FA14DRAFT_174781 [Meira miltonrushii]
MTSSQAGPSRPRALEPLRTSYSRSAGRGANEGSNASKAFIPLRPSVRADQSSNRIALQSQNTQKKALEPIRITKQYAAPVQQPSARRALEPIGGRRSRSDQSSSISDSSWSNSSGETKSYHRKRALEPIEPRQVAPRPQDRQKTDKADIAPVQKRSKTLEPITRQSIPRLQDKQEAEIVSVQKRRKALEPIKRQSAGVSSGKLIANCKVREPIKSSTNTASPIEGIEVEQRKVNNKAMIPLKSRLRKEVEADKKSEGESSHRKVMLPIRPRSAVDTEEGKKGKALEPLRRSDKQSMDQVCAGSRAYAALDHARHATKILCYDLQRMKPCSNKNGISLGTYSHLKRETVFVHIVGRIVGIEEKDHKVKWLIDDGSAVVAAHHAYDPRPVVVQKDVESKVDKGKRRAVEETVDMASGIPSEYIRPPTPIKVPKRETKIEAILRATTNNQKFKHTYRHLPICSLVSVVGRVDSWFKGEMIVQVDRIIPSGFSKDEPTVRAPREGYIELLNNPNMESEHIHDTVLLATTEYANDAGTAPAEPPQDQSVANRIKVGPAGSRSERHEEANRLRQSKRKFDENSTESEKKEKRQNNDTNTTYSPRLSADVEASTTLPEQSAPQRRMRDFRKIPDRQINDQLLRIYVQKHISDHCRQPLDAEDQARGDLPPTFTINYLQTVTTLRLLADRVVDVAVKKREGKKRKIEANASTSSTSHPVRDAGKRQRLFESVIRNIVADGMVVVSDGRKHPPVSPFNGEKPRDFSEFLRSKQGKLLDWEEGKDEHSMCKFTPTVVSGDFVTAKQMQTEEDVSMMRWRGSHKTAQSKGQEVYQVVTPTLLADPIREVVGFKSGEAFDSIPAHKIKERLRLLDDRWQYIRPESVAESIAYLRAQL